MKLLAVLVLCCGFCCSGASPLPDQDVDCDDPNVFEAVDLGLREYNRERRDGNQFALYMVTEAKRSTGPGAELLVKYRIRETSCAVGGAQVWRDCDYRASGDAESGECTTRVYIEEATKATNVLQECEIIQAEGKVTHTRASCTGCYVSISSDSSAVLVLVRAAIKVFNNNSDQPFLFEVGGITDAEVQVVNGWNYKLKYEIKQTDCSKSEFPDLAPECRPVAGGRKGLCEMKAYVNLSNALVDLQQACKLEVEETISPPDHICLGCPKNIALDSPELPELLRVTMEKYNTQNSNDTYYYKIEAVTKATVQVVAGKRYVIGLEVKRTNCSKADFEKLNEDCQAEKYANTLDCIASVYVVPWQEKIIPEISCTARRVKQNVLARRPPGFTPFRKAFVSGTPLQLPVIKVPPHDQRPGKGLAHGLQPDHHRHGHGHEKQKNEKKEGKDRHHHSKKTSEESREEVENQGQILSVPITKQPEVPESTSESTLAETEALSVLQATAPPSEAVVGIPDLPGDPEGGSSLSDQIQDLPPEPSPPKCPGKPWKPITVLSPNPKVLKDEDLLPLTGGEGTPAPQGTPPSATQRFFGNFDLQDAL